MKSFDQKGGDVREKYLKYRGLERCKQADKLTRSVIKENTHMSKINDLLTESNKIMDLKEDNQSFDQEVTSDTVEMEMDQIRESFTEEEMKELREIGFKKVYEFMKVYRRIEEIKKELEKELNALITSLYKDPTTRESTLTWKEVGEVETAIASLSDKIDMLANKNPENFLTYGLLRLREYKKDFEETGIIETPGIKKITTNLMKDVRKQLEGTNGLAVLLGDTGTGKTVVARKIAAELSENSEYEFIGAHSRMTPDDLLHRFGIVAEDFSAEQIPQLIKDAQAKYRAEHGDIDKKVLKEDLDIIAESIQQQASEKVMTTVKIKETVERAMDKGVIVVIDEFNYLPPETLASLNDVLSNKQSKEGFGIIMTGNIGKKFKNRKDLDPAFVNRISSGTIKYNYPPQEIDAILKNSIISSEQVSEGETIKPRDLFITGLVQSLDAKGNLVGPSDTLDKIWDLSQVFSVIQQIAGGKSLHELGLSPEAIADISKFNFQSFFLSFRNYNNIIREWKMDGYEYPVDWYIYKNIIKPATILAPREAAQLFYIFQLRGGLFQGEEWSGIEVDSQSWSISGVDIIRIKKDFKQNQTSQKYFTPQEVVEAAFGQEMPSYQNHDEYKDSIEITHNEEFVTSMENFEEKQKTFEAENSYVLEVCQN